MKIIFLTTLTLFLFFKVNTFGQYNFDKFITEAQKDMADSNYTKAIDKLNICILAAPGNYSVYFYRGICKYSLYDDIGAERDFTTSLTEYNPFFYDSYQNRSLVRYRMGNYPGAISDISKVIEKEPNEPRLYVQRAFDLLANNDFNGAINDCKKAMKLNWIGADAYLCKAVAEDALADYDNALCDYDEAIKINSGNVDLYVRRGMTKFKMDNVSDAIDDYNYALRIDSACTFAYYNRAEAEAKLENYKKALADYNTVLFYEPRNAYGFFNRGVLYSNMKKYREAIDDFDKVIILNPNNIQAYFNRAKLKQNIKDYKGAIRDYDKVIELYPYFTEAYYNRAQIKFSLGETSAAKKDIETGKVMSEVLHSKNNVQLSRDSVLLANLFRLSADFANSSSTTTDTVDVGLLPIFYVAEKDSTSSGHFSYFSFLDKLNNKKNQLFYFSNEPAVAPDNNESNTLSNNTDSIKVTITNSNEYLRDAISKTNSMLLNEANEYYDKIISVDINNAIAWFSRGVNKYREIEMINNSNEQYTLPNSSHTIVQNDKNESCKSALADFTKALQLQPKFYFAYYNRGNVKCLLQDFEGALKDYETAIKINPDFAQAYFNEGFLLYYLNNREQACTDFSKASELGVTESYYMMKRYCFK